MRLNALFSSGFVFACELYLWNSLSLLGGALRSVGVESLALSLALAVAVAQATDVQKRAGGLRSAVLWCTWLAAVALVAVAEAQAKDVQKRAGGLRLGMLWCTWSAAVARSGGGAGHRRAEVLRGAFLACSQLLVLMAYEVEWSLIVWLSVCVRALPLELVNSTW